MKSVAKKIKEENRGRFVVPANISQEGNPTRNIVFSVASKLKTSEAGRG